MRIGENIYQRKDGRYEGRYKKGRKQDGKIYYGYVYGYSKQEVREKLYPLKEKYKGLRNNYGESCMTFGEWRCAWIYQLKNKIKVSTLASYTYKIKKYLSEPLDDLALNEIDLDVAQSLMDQLLNLLSPGTVKVIHQIVKSCFEQAVKKQLIKQNPFRLVTLPKMSKTKVQALRKSEQKKLEAVALEAGKKQGLPTVLALYTGLRIGEISALKWQNINFSENMIYVTDTLQRVSQAEENKKTAVIQHSSKTAAAYRAIPFNKKIRRLLLQHRKETTGEYVFSSHGKPCEPRLLTYYFHKIREKAGLLSVHFHQLRHTFATRCLEKSSDIPSVSALLGHSSSQMTLDVYAHSLMSQRIQIIKLLEQA